MDYEKKYKEAVKAIKELSDSFDDDNLTNELGIIFPELKESEDERMIRYFKDLAPFDKAEELYEKYGFSHKDAIAWLEKQGEQKPVVVPKFKVGDVIKDIEDGEIFTIRTITKDKYIYTDDSFDWIKDQDVYELVEQKPANSIWHEMTENPEGDENDRTLVVFEDGYSTTSNALLHIGFGISKAYKWAYVNDILRLTSKTKQGEQKPVNKAKIGEKYVCVNCPRYTCFITGCVYEVKDGFMAALIGLCSNCFELYEVVDEQQVEPKFKVGDWIVRELDNTCYQIKKCILNVTNNKYGYDLTNGGYISSQDADFYHLWTIQDAKDGDVLNSIRVKATIIFKEWNLDGKHINAYCALQKGILIKQEMLWDRDFELATKEQRDLLFQKMKEAGYEWDAERKELKKIEQNPWSEEDENNLHYWLDNNKSIDGDKYRWLKSLKDRVLPQPKQEWSEEDKKMIQDIINDIAIAQEQVYCKSRCEDEINWLKSLRPQNTWKPQKKQIVALRYVLNHLPYCTHKEEISGLLDQIKDL